MGMEQGLCTIIQAISHENSLKLYEKILRMPNKEQSPENTIYMTYFVGFMYILRGGIQWRMLPADYPKWQLVYYYFSVWSKPDDEGISLLDRLLKKIGQKSA